MKASNALRIVSACLTAPLVGFACAPALADSLSVESVKDTYYVFEPIVVTVVLHLDEPYVHARGDPREAIRQQRRLDRRLKFELRDADGTVCNAMLAGGKFKTDQEEVHEFFSTCIGVLGTLTIPGEREAVFRLWDTPGDYTLVVVDTAHELESGELSIAIVLPETSAIPASELFESGGLATVAALHGLEHGDTVRPLFERLAKRYPNTVYGKYARVALALRRAQSLRGGTTKLEPGMRSALATELKEVAGFLRPGHPLRSRALLHLARLRAAPDVDGDPQETVKMLLSETSDGVIVHEAKLFLLQLAQFHQHEGDTVVDDADREQ